jgi:hypothetical protein
MRGWFKLLLATWSAATLCSMVVGVVFLLLRDRYTTSSLEPIGFLGRLLLAESALGAPLLVLGFRLKGWELVVCVMGLGLLSGALFLIAAD